MPWLTGSAACLCLVAGWVEFLAQELAFIFISPSRIIERSFDSSSLHLKATMLVIFPVFLTRTVVWKFSGISFIHGLRFVFFNTFVKAVFGGLRLKASCLCFVGFFCSWVFFFKLWIKTLLLLPNLCTISLGYAWRLSYQFQYFAQNSKFLH